MDKILVGTIFSEVKDYAIKKWFKNVCSFIHPQFDFYAVDNSKDIRYHKKILNSFLRDKQKSNIKGLQVVHVPRSHAESEIFMADSAKTLREYFLRNNYDWLLYNECDIFPPYDIIEILLSYNKAIMSAVFFTGAKHTSYPMLSQLNHYWDKITAPVKSYLEGFYDMGEIETPKEIFSAGLGCVLIHKSIVQSIPFRHYSSVKFHHDTLFVKDLLEMGIQNYYAPIICRHDNTPWTIQRKLIAKK